MEKVKVVGGVKLPQVEMGSRELKKIKPYITGTDVRRLQQNLKWFGIYHGQVDGIFGPETENAVRKYQKIMKMKATGTADDKLIKILQKMIIEGAGEWRTFQKDFCHTGHSPVLLSSSRLEILKIVKAEKPVSLAAEKNILYIAEENYVGALRLNSRKFAWKTEVSPYSVSIACGKVLVSAEALVVLDACSGRTIIEFRHDEFRAPAVVGSCAIYASSERGIIYALNWNGEMIWRYRTSADYITPLTFASGFLYFGSLSNVCCLDDKGVLCWKARISGLIKEPVLVFGERVLAVNDEGSIFCLDAKTGKIFWNKNFGEEILAPCFLGKSAIAVSIGGKVVALDAEDGNLKWEEDLNVPPAAPSISCADAIYIPTDAGLVALNPGGERIKTYFEGRSISHVIQARFGLVVAAGGFLWELLPVEML